MNEVDAIISKHGYEFLINVLAHRHRYTKKTFESYKKLKNKRRENEEKRFEHLRKSMESEYILYV